MDGRLLEKIEKIQTAFSEELAKNQYTVMNPYEVSGRLVFWAAVAMGLGINDDLIEKLIELAKGCQMELLDESEMKKKLN